MKASDLLGKQYSCRFRVAVIGAPGSDPAYRYMDRPVVLYMHGDRYVIGEDELIRLVESGFVVEEGP